MEFKCRQVFSSLESMAESEAQVKQRFVGRQSFLQWFCISVCDLG